MPCTPYMLRDTSREPYRSWASAVLWEGHYAAHVRDRARSGTATPFLQQALGVGAHVRPALAHNCQSTGRAAPLLSHQPRNRPLERHTRLSTTVRSLLLQPA